MVIRTMKEGWNYLLNHLIRKGVKENHGFTLLELLVATTLLALVLTGVYSIFLHPARSWEAGQKAVIETQQLRTVFQKIGADLSSTVSSSIVHPYPFLGTSHYFNFFYFTDEGEIKERFHGKNFGDPSYVFYDFFLEQDIRIEYFDQQQQVWRNSWDSNHLQALPSLVRITFLSKDIDTESVAFTWPIYAGRKVVRRSNVE